MGKVIGNFFQHFYCKKQRENSNTLELEAKLIVKDLNKIANAEKYCQKSNCNLWTCCFSMVRMDTQKF